MIKLPRTIGHLLPPQWYLSSDPFVSLYSYLVQDHSNNLHETTGSRQLNINIVHVKSCRYWKIFKSLVESAFLSRLFFATSAMQTTMKTRVTKPIIAEAIMDVVASKTFGWGWNHLSVSSTTSSGFWLLVWIRACSLFGLLRGWTEPLGYFSASIGYSVAWTTLRAKWRCKHFMRCCRSIPPIRSEVGSVLSTVLYRDTEGWKFFLQCKLRACQ